MAFAVEAGLPLLVLGEGSNIVLVDDFPGVVLKLAIRGLSIIKESADSVWLEVGAGENWHRLVQWSLSEGYCGLENLSLIPGSVGAAPIQNIGAYGVELKQVFESLQAIDRNTGEQLTFELASCGFAYRDSVFKQALKDRYVITRLTLRLSKQQRLHTGYGAIEAELHNMGLQEFDAADVSRAVCNIRRSKSPDPEEIGNAGSFFKNPVIDKVQFGALKRRFPNIVAFPDPEDRIKLAAAWLIERCGWKGYRQGDIGVHSHQALVLVNYGAGHGSEILDLAHRIKGSVSDKFGIELEIEPRVYQLAQ